MRLQLCPFSVCLFICRLLLSAISMEKSPEWHSQQGGLITHFNQLYRWGLLFRPDHYKFLCSLLGMSSQTEPRLAFISPCRGQPDFSSVVLAALREKEQAFPKATRRLVRAAERIRCCRGGNEGRVARAEQAGRTGVLS